MVDSQPLPQSLSPCSSGRRSSCDAKSPEFEFWMLRNPINFPQPNLLSADELFSDGVLLPLSLLHLSDEPPPPPPLESTAAAEKPVETESGEAPDPEHSAVQLATTSKRWRYIFSRSDKKRFESSVNGRDNGNIKEKELIRDVKEKKREKKVNGGGGGAGNVVSAAELNINIWPFSRSRSAGNGGNRPRSAAAAAARKVSSAPCSRSNSTGESKSRKWPNSPSRGGGVHLGRSSPVWQIRRAGGGGAARSTEAPVRSAEKCAKKYGNESRRNLPEASSRGGGGGSKARVLSLNVPMCIGYRHNLSCKSDENSAVSVAAAAAGGGRGGEGGSRIGGDVAGEGVRRSNLLNIRSLFTKKVY